MAKLWFDGSTWCGTKIIEGVLFTLEETDDRSCAEQHSYIWRTRGGLQAHLTDDERERLPM